MIMNKMDSLITLIHENFPDAHTELFCGDLYVSHISDPSTRIQINTDDNYLTYNFRNRTTVIFSHPEQVINSLRLNLFKRARSA